MQYTSIDQFTDDMLVDRYIELRDQIKVEGERLAEATREQLRPYQEWMDAIGSVLHARLLERKNTAGSVPGGTFFLSQSMRLRVADQNAFLTYVFDNRATDLIAASATKDGVRAYIEINKIAPPGVEVTYVQNLTVRRK